MKKTTPATSEDMASSLDTLNALKSLIQRADSGEEVEHQIEQCLNRITERGCQNMEDALALAALAQMLYGRSVEMALRGNHGLLQLVLGADRHMNTLLAFLEQRAGKGLLEMDAYRTALN